MSRSPLAMKTVPLAFCFCGNGGEKIICLEARRFRILEAAGGNKFGQHLKLLKQGVIEFASALIGWKRPA